jgi:hypothetical protein
MPGLAAAAAAAAAEATADVCKQVELTVVPLLQLSAVIPPLNALMRISVVSAASTARGEAETLFSGIDQEQQQRVSVCCCV